MSKNLEQKLNQIIDLALEEDLGSIGDITSKFTIPEDKMVNFIISNRQDIILCGVDIVIKIFNKINNKGKLSIIKHHSDGDFLTKNSKIISGSGNAREIFAAERVALNLMQHLSGISTRTNEFVKKLSGNTQILDTRKTIPTFRYLQKYAVKIGGGKNHRMSLFDGFLIKDNHIAAAGSIKNAVNRIRNNPEIEDFKNLPIEVECDNLDQTSEAVEAKVDIILLDNMSINEIKQAKKLINNKIKIEVSGNIAIDNIEEISKLGIDYISVGSLTHSVKAIDIGLDIE